MVCVHQHLSQIWCVYTSTSHRYSACTPAPLTDIVRVHQHLSQIWCVYTSTSHRYGVCTPAPLTDMVCVHQHLSQIWCVYTSTSHKYSACTYTPAPLTDIVCVHQHLSQIWCVYTSTSHRYGVCTPAPLTNISYDSSTDEPSTGKGHSPINERKYATGQNKSGVGGITTVPTARTTLDTTPLPTVRTTLDIVRSNSSMPALFTNSTGPTSRPGDYFMDDEEEFGEVHDWSSVHTFVNVRQQPPMWYIYSISVFPVLTGLLLHPLVHFGNVYGHRDQCLLVMYLAEYGFFALGTNLILTNFEIFFTKVLPLPKFLTSEFNRFVIMTLAGWLYSSILVAHVIVANNKGEVICFHIEANWARTSRLVFREIIPTTITGLFSIATIATYCLKKSRMMMRPDVSGMKEVRFDVRNDEGEWIRCVLFLNAVMLTRAVTMSIVANPNMPVRPLHYKILFSVHVLHSQSIYFVPYCALFISDVRTSLLTLIRRALNFLSNGNLRFGEDLENLSVSFGNIAQST
ncbi:hypothetical protein MAR_007539 [Mya arenaria]|uniref:G protein-coupled receptor n=1 Tax=Mya arenaria TaxID=6604 RepID=A0ABY7DG54_MYAAR|nr:hypothetical protein MAR_007539 [Mya arenaria]